MDYCYLVVMATATATAAIAARMLAVSVHSAVIVVICTRNLLNGKHVDLATHWH